MHTTFLTVLLPLVLSAAGNLVHAAADSNVAGEVAGDCNQGWGSRNEGSKYGHAWRHAQSDNGPSEDQVAAGTSEMMAPANDDVFDPSTANVQQNAVTTTMATAALRSRQTVVLGSRTRISSSSTSSTPANSAPTSGTGSGTLDAFSQQILDAHNAARAPRGAKALVWDATLTNAAKAWAEKCVWKHGGNEGISGGAGQNLAAGASTAATASQSAQTVVNLWMAEEKDYDPNNPVFSAATGHYTQVVWKSSTRLGCYQQSCPASSFVGADGRPVFPTMRSAVYTVCNYGPPGNYRGQFSTNVQKLGA